MSEVATEAPRVEAPVSVSVVLCCYTMERWRHIVAATESLRAQSLPPTEILLVVDHCPALRERAVRELPGVRVLDNDGPPGLSSARNVGVEASSGDVVAFLDDDAVAEPEWLGRLASEYADPCVLGVGGHISPLWESRRPSWFPPEFDWVVGCSHAGMPSGAAEVRNLIGANMSFRRDVLSTVGGFRADLGRVGSHPAGCEETELCIRAAARFPGGVLCYQPQATVHHHVPESRATWRYFRARCYAEGLSKAAVSRVTGAERALSSERAYVSRVLPRGLAKAAASINPGRAAALVTGLSATAMGYAVGTLARRHQDAAEARGHLLRTAATTAPLVLAMALWLLSLRSVDLAAMTDLGLVSVLPAGYWAGLALLVVTIPVLIHRDRTPTALLVAYLVALILMFHATPSALYESLRYSWAWKHVGVVDYIVRHHSVDPQGGGVFNVYQAWPGFFAVNAVLVKAAGLSSALSYAAWSPPLFELAALFPLRLLFSTLSSDRRQVWLAVLVFYLGNWVGQDYFSPQAFAYLLYLVILGACLRWLPPSRPQARMGRWRRWLGLDLQTAGTISPVQRRAVLAMVGLLMLAVVSSHQLTPFMLLSTLCLLVLGRHIGPAWLPVMLAALTAAWMVTMGRTFLEANFYWLAESIGHPGANAEAGLVDLSRTSIDQRLVYYAKGGLSAGLVVLAGVGWLRLRRARAPRRGAALLAVSTLPLLAANSYGGEITYRVYLFALPFLALLTAGIFYPSASRSWFGAAVPATLALALAAPLCLAYYGKERANYFSPQEVAASEWLYSHAPGGSLLISAEWNLPWGFTHYEDYYYTSLEGLPTPDRAALTTSPMVEISRAMVNQPGPTYVILTRSQIVYARYTGVLPTAGITALTTALQRDPSFRVVYHNPDAIIFEQPHKHAEPSR